MPSQAGFIIKQNTPEADKLERRLHEQLKEIWDPAADATVARYLTAMLAKGYDRKKIHSQLKAILQEAVSVQLLDWLYKHLRLHGNEYQSKEPPASSKPIPKPPVLPSKTPQAMEEELRLEDLEAQQLEGSDLDDDEPSEIPKHNSHADTAATGPAAGDRGQDQARELRGNVGQLSSLREGEVAQRAVFQEPLEKTETLPAAPQVVEQKPDAASVAGRQATAMPERRERRQREPIPIPTFTEPTRAGPSKAAAPESTRTAPEPSTTAQTDTAGAATQPPTAGKPETDAGRQTSPPRDRRRLKSSVVLDWESWQKERQPGAGRSRDRDQAEGAGPGDKQSGAPFAGPPKSSDQALPTAGKADREREREKDRGGDVSGRREGGLESRRADRDGGSTAMRWGHERDGGSDMAGGGRRRAGDRDMGTAVPQGLKPRSRSRSRSRSPRGGGRRTARGAAVAAPANLLRTALRGVDAVPPSGGPPSAPRSIAQPPHAAAGTAEGAAKPSVFARLGAGGGEAPMDGQGRSARSQRPAGADKAMDVPAAGRKRGLTGPHGAEGADDNHVLGSPPKAARGAPPPKHPSAAPPATQVGGKQAAAAASGSTAPGASRQRVTGPNQGGAVRAPILLPVQQPQPVTAADRLAVAAGGKDSKVESAESGGPGVDELKALRQQMAAMQEQIARMEAEKLQAQQQQPALGAAAEGPQQQHLPATGSGRLPAPTSSAAGAGGPSASAMRGGVLPLEMSDVIIEGGRGSPPPRKAPGASRPGMEAVPGAGGSGGGPPRMTAAQLDAEMRSVVVENVHFMANEQVVAAHFSVVGPVRKVIILRDGFTGQPSGMAVVEMATEAATQAAATLSGSLLMNMPIVVTLKAALLLQEMGMGSMPMDLGTIAATVRGDRNASAVLDGPGSLGMPATRLNPAAAPFVPLAMVGGSGIGRPPLMGAVTAGRQGAGATAGTGRPPWPGRGGRGRFSNVWVREAAETVNANGTGAEKVA